MGLTPFPLQNLIPGDEGVEQEIVAGEVLAAGSTVTMRAAFSHPELMLPLKQLQEVCFDSQCCGCKRMSICFCILHAFGLRSCDTCDELHLPSCNL